jgi:cyclophilin family peptidyl-prolyl cis-trans isomerase
MIAPHAGDLRRSIMKSICFLYVLTQCLLLTVTTSTAGTLVQFRTSLGDMVVELYDREKPVTVANFIRYVDSGQYTNIFFHRCVPGFVAQGGGFGVPDPTSTNLLSVYIPVEAYGAITNEFAIGTRYSNVYGTIAMAKTTNSPDTATCQWFFNLADNSANLDNQNGGFTVFGHVIKGTNVLDQFNSRSLWNGIVNLDGGLFNAVPVTYAGVAWPKYQQLIYVDIEPLSANIHLPAGGACTLLWNSVAGMTNIVEYADSLSAGSWHPLLSTNPPGGMLCVTNSTLGTTSRVYRIRVE